MQVLKFGGSSVENADAIKKSVAIVQQALEKDRTMVVVSALGGTTDQLIEAGKMASLFNEEYKDIIKLLEKRHLQTVQELIPVAQQSAILSLVMNKFNEIESICEGVFLLRELSLRTLDRIMSYGELLSSHIFAYVFESLKTEHIWVDSRNLIRTDSGFGNALVNYEITNNQIHHFIEQNISQLYVFPGFIGSNDAGIITTLGRGGSDFTAAILASAVQADVLEIWTDVNGIMTADPRLVSSAKLIEHISYQEAMELSHFGAKVIYTPTIQPVMSKSIPVWIKNTFLPDSSGTLIENNILNSKNSVRGISSIGNLALLSLEGSGMVGVPGISSRLFKTLSNEKINVILITQGSSEHSICFAIEEQYVQTACDAVNSMFSSEIQASKIDPLKAETGLSILALVGDNMKNHPGISGKMFGVLGRNGVNIRAIAQGSSEKNISAVISSFDVKKALNVLHEEFFETVYKQINIFIAGVGNVGSKLVEQLRQQQTYLKEHLRLQIRVVGIANSRTMIFNDQGLNLETWQDQLTSGDQANLDEFIHFIQEKNLRNSVFVDVTASPRVAGCYTDLLKKSVSVVACNKIACSSEFDHYKSLKRLANEFNALFLFETNVGAGLPVIGTLSDLIKSGDQLISIEAVLSGTLNFVFNQYDSTIPFAEVVKRAQDEGYTEPDPRIDLSGSDVMKKILILARESGMAMEMNEIECESFLPDSCMQGDVAHFYNELAKHEEYFKSLYLQSFQNGNKLRFVAKIENKKASVGLQDISADHDLYNLKGKDNVVLFYTRRYPHQPLAIKGAGAGAEVTASGIFADIIRTARI